MNVPALEIYLLQAMIYQIRGGMMKVLMEIKLNKDAFKFNGIMMTKTSMKMILAEIISNRLIDSPRIKNIRILEFLEEK